MSGGIAQLIVQAYGGVPMNITMNDAYDAATKGLVDVVVSPMEALQSWKFADFTKSITLPPFRFCTANVTVMNLDKWNSLPKDIQQLFTYVATQMPDVVGQAWWYSDLTGIDYFTGKGGKVIEPPAQDQSLWADPLKPMITDYVNKANAAGLPGSDYIAYIQQRADYWNQNHTVTAQSCKTFFEQNLAPLK